MRDVLPGQKTIHKGEHAKNDREKFFLVDVKLELAPRKQTARWY